MNDWCSVKLNNISLDEAIKICNMVKQWRFEPKYPPFDEMGYEGKEYYEFYGILGEFAIHILKKNNWFSIEYGIEVRYPNEYKPHPLKPQSILCHYEKNKKIEACWKNIEKLYNEQIQNKFIQYSKNIRANFDKDVKTIE